MAEFAKPGQFLIQMDFQEFIPAEDKSLRVGSKAYILTRGAIEDDFNLQQIKGEVEGVEYTPEEVSEEIGIYSETELENLKRQFLERGYLKQEEKPGPYQITTKGLVLWNTYRHLVRLKALLNKFEYKLSEEQLYLMKSVGKLPITSENHSVENEEKIEQLTEESKMWDDEEDLEDGTAPRELMKESFQADFRDGVLELEKIDQEIQDCIEEIEFFTDWSKVLEGEKVEEVKEIEEIVKNLISKLISVEVQPLSSEESILDKYDQNNNWSLNKSE
jgi:hypothetical protein